MSIAVHLDNRCKNVELACKLNSEAIAEVGKYIKDGVTTLELDKIAEDFILTRGGKPAFKGYKPSFSGTAYPFTINASIDEEVVHGMPSSRKLREGQIISIDCGTLLNGFYGDSAYTFAVGSISQEKQMLLDVTKESLLLGIEKAIAGQKVYDIARAIQTHVEKNNFSVVRELVGHGIGESLHEEPSIPNFVPGLLHRSRFPNERLYKGQTIAIEPMVNSGSFVVQTANDGWTVYATDGKPSAHFEHTIMVDEGMARVLTFFP